MVMLPTPGDRPAAREWRCLRRPGVSGSGFGLAWLFHSGEWRNWQTRRIQVPVSERVWGFKSPLAHHETPGESGDLWVDQAGAERCCLASNQPFIIFSNDAGL